MAGCLAAVALLATASAASAVTYRPTRTDDPAPNGCKKKDCSLREAVIAANASGMPATILLRPGRRYVLTRPGLSEDAAATGDLDVTSDLTVGTKGLVGIKKGQRGAKLAVIDGNDIDRIFDVHGPGLSLDWIVARDGHARKSAGDVGDGGAVRGGSLNLLNSRLVSNVAAGNGGAFATTASASPFNFAMKAALLKGNSAAGNGGAVYLSGSPGPFGGADQQRPGRPQQRRRLRGGHLRHRAGYRTLDHRRQSVRGGRRRDRLQRHRIELHRVVDRLGEPRRLLRWRHPHNRRFDGA